MKDYSNELMAHLRGESLSTALLWRVQRRDGTQILGTEHDADLLIQGQNDADGLYLAGSNITGSNLRSTADLAVDNMEVTGAMPTHLPDFTTNDVTAHDIEAGLFRQAAVWIYLCNWRRPQDGIGTVKRGFLGDIGRDSDGKYITEIRALGQVFAQGFIRTYSERCQVRNFGDAECGIDVPAISETGLITAVHSRRRFDSTLTGTREAGYFSLGEVLFTSGDNAGYTKEVKRDDEDDIAGHVSLWDQLPAALQVGDTFIIRSGCDRRASICKDKYNNILNMRAYGLHIEGIDALMRGPA